MKSISQRIEQIRQRQYLARITLHLGGVIEISPEEADQIPDWDGVTLRFFDWITQRMMFSATLEDLCRPDHHWHFLVRDP